MALGRILEDHGSLAPEVWNHLAGSHSPFVRWEWLACLEESGSASASRGWTPSHLVLEEVSRPIGLCPLYVRDTSHGEFVSHGGIERAARGAGLRAGPRAVVGVPHTPVVGPRLLVAAEPGAPSEGNLRRMLGKALLAQAQVHGWASVHVNFCEEEEAAILESCGFLVRRSWQFIWSNEGYGDFEEFLGCLRSKRRTMIRRELKAFQEQGLSVAEQAGEAAGEQRFAEMARAYSMTSRHWGESSPRLNECFFALLHQYLRASIEFQVATDPAGMVGMTLSVRWNDTLYGRYWGCLRPHPFLHFNVAYYAGIASCIRRQLGCFDPGHGGDYKWARGFEPRPVFSAHWYAEQGLHQAVREWARRESQWVEQQLLDYKSRGPFKSVEP